jgi:hypothetical protein
MNLSPTDKAFVNHIEPETNGYPDPRVLRDSITNEIVQLDDLRQRRSNGGFIAAAQEMAARLRVLRAELAMLDAARDVEALQENYAWLESNGLRFHIIDEVEPIVSQEILDELNLPSPGNPVLNLGNWVRNNAIGVTKAPDGWTWGPAKIVPSPGMAQMMDEESLIRDLRQDRGAWWNINVLIHVDNAANTWLRCTRAEMLAALTSRRICKDEKTWAISNATVLHGNMYTVVRLDCIPVVSPERNKCVIKLVCMSPEYLWLSDEEYQDKRKTRRLRYRGVDLFAYEIVSEVDGDGGQVTWFYCRPESDEVKERTRAEIKAKAASRRLIEEEREVERAAVKRLNKVVELVAGRKRSLPHYPVAEDQGMEAFMTDVKVVLGLAERLLQAQPDSGA